MIIRHNLEISDTDAELREYLKEYLTILNPEWLDAQTFGRWTGSVPKYLTQYSEENGKVFVPRGVMRHILEDLGRDWQLQDERVVPASKTAWPAGKIILRPDDQELAVNQLLSFDSGFLSAPAGSGKTVMGLEAARRLGLRALWLTHRKELKDQAIERAVELLDLPMKEIGVLHGNTWKLGEHLTVGMVPTLRKRDLAEIASYFGTIIIDEAHHVPSSTFLNVVDKFKAYYVYGLTATAYRRDKLDSIMFNAIGPIVAKIEHEELFEDEHLMIPTIKRRNTGWNPPDSVLMEYHDFMEAMVSDTRRNNIIVNDIVRECIPGNTCVVLVERTKHAEILTALLKDQGIRCEFVVGSVDVDVEDAKTGKKKKKAIPKEVRNKVVSDFREGRTQVLVATYDLLAEGFDYKPLNRLFMASPIKWKGTVVQSIGRVQRPHEKKKDAIVYDYVDDVAMFHKQAESRLFRVYKPMGMKVLEE